MNEVISNEEEPVATAGRGSDSSNSIGLVADVRLPNVALGMSDTEVKAALAFKRAVHLAVA